MRIDSFSKRFLAIIAVAVAAVIVFGIASSVVSEGFVKSTDEVVIVQATVDGDNLHVFGYTKASGWVLVNHEVSVIDRALYLKMRFAPQLKRGARQNGNFERDVIISSADIDQIYLQGSAKEDT